MTAMLKRRLLLSGSGGDLVIPSPVIPSPVLGPELLMNGDLDAWTLGNPDGWTVTGESGTDPEVSQVGSGELQGGGGAGAANFYRSGGGFSALYLSQSGVATKDTWVQVQQICSASSGGAYNIAAGTTLKNNYTGVRDLILTGLITTTGALRINNYTAPANYTVDSISMRALTLNSLISNTAPFGAVTSIKVKVTQSASIVADGGVIFNLDNPINPRNFLLASFDSVYTVALRKCVNGVFTTLTFGTVSYLANAEIQVTNTLNTFTLRYRGSIVGTPQTVTDIALVNNPYCGVFCTSPLMTLRDFRVAG